MSDEPSQQVPPNDILSGGGAIELATSPEMRPYLQLISARVQGHDTAPRRAVIAALPLEKRYVWRVALALKWAFADLEPRNLEVDCETLGPEDHEQLVGLLMNRPVQFCLFLSALFGEEQMEQLMALAVQQAREIGASPAGPGT